MANKVLQTRLALLYKTYAELDAIKTTFIPLKGEVCFCEVPQNQGEVQQEPCLIFKVGDGVHNFESLPWTSALAADVFAWAKKENLEFKDLSDDFKDKIKGLVESQTQYRIVSDKEGIWKLQRSDNAGVSYKDVEGSNLDVATLLADKVKEYSIVKDPDPGEFASIYHLTKDGANIGDPIEIAKDQLLKSVTIKTCTEDGKPISGLVVDDKYLDFEFEITSGTSHTYLAIKDMIQPYTAGDGIEIDSNNKIKVSAIEITKVNGLQKALDSKVNLPKEPITGNGINIPYYFSVDYSTNKATVTDYTVDLLDSTKDPQQFSLDINSASSLKAGLMSANDKTNLDKALLEDDILILNCNL